MIFMSALTETLKTAPAVCFGVRMQQLASAAVLALSLNLPAYAEKIEAVGQATKEHPANPALLAVFTGLNVVAGVAILATIVFSVIWFLQRKDDDDEEEDELEEELEAEAAKPTVAKDTPAAAVVNESEAKAEVEETSAEKSEDAGK